MPSTNDLRDLLRSDAERVARTPFPVEQVIERGQRARRRRRIAAVAGACAAAGVIAVPVALVQDIGVSISPASPPSASVATSVPVSSLAENERPVVDADTGVLRSPIERYQATPLEDHEISFAWDLLVTDCVADRGFVWKTIDLRSAEQVADRRYGIWTMTEATTLGYGVPPTSEAETEALAWKPTEETVDAAMSCARSMETNEAFADLAMPKLVDPPPSGDYDAAVASEAVDDWKACLETAGIQPPTDGWIPPAAEYADRETEIQIAVQDVTCKEQTDLVQRLADLEASYDAPYIRAHEADLIELRRQIDSTVALARQVIADHGR